MTKITGGLKANARQTTGIMREYGLMFRLPSLQSFVTGIIILSAGALAYWLHDRLLVMIVGTLSWWLGGMAFAWAGMVTLYYLLTVLYIKHEWHKSLVEALPEVDTPQYMQAVTWGRRAEVIGVPPDHFARDIHGMQCAGVYEEQLYMVADRIINHGAHLTFAEFTPHWNGFTRGRFGKFQAEMVRRKYARWENIGEHRSSTQLNESGVDFLEDVLKYVSPPPPQ